MSELSQYEQDIFDLVYVLEQQPELFTPEDRSSLEDLLTTLPDDIEKISEQIILWCETHPHIEAAIFDLSLNSNKRGAGGRKTKITPEKAQELIKNAVRQSNSSTK